MASAAGPLVCHGHSRPIVDVQYSTVTEDGYFLISASKDGKPMLRNGETGDWIGTFEGHKGAVWSAQLNEAATHAVTGSADFSACVWDAFTGDLLHTFQHKHIVRATHFAKSSASVLTAGYEKVVKLFDLYRPDAPPALLEGAPGPIRCARYFADDSLVLSAVSDDSGLRVWDVRTQSVATTVDTGSPILAIELSPCGRYISCAGGQGVRFFDASTFAPIKEAKFDFEVECCAMSPDAKHFAVGGTDMWVHLHDFATLEEVDTGKGHHGPVHSVQFAPGGGHYASGSEDGTIRIWTTGNAAGVPEEAVKQMGGLQVEG
mmetsp:Transcript_10312/g.35908  ORF Transcript_10312/g.35908 Transcript_10312/m.35908 type:complete len:318 (-) Transcript_10312:15-968(-)